MDLRTVQITDPELFQLLKQPMAPTTVDHTPLKPISRWFVFLSSFVEKKKKKMKFDIRLATSKSRIFCTFPGLIFVTTTGFSLLILTSLKRKYQENLVLYQKLQNVFLSTEI